jgi:putative transposase
VVEAIQQAHAEGARLGRACDVAGLSVRTFERWTRTGEVRPDGRPSAVRPPPANRLSEAERRAILATINEPRFASLPPSQIVPILADEGVYRASESSFYRVMRAAGQQHRRGRAATSVAREPATHRATAPRQVWCWDITYLPSRVRGLFFYLYLVLDLYSRKIVGWEVHAEESGEHAAALLKRSVLAEGVWTERQPLVLHADNGSPATLRATLQWLGVTPSYSRPRVSNDNAYAESVFRTCKYRPDYPAEGFTGLEEARQWVGRFVRWYNEQHRHSGLKFVTPAQRHDGQAEALMAHRQQVYAAAKARHPQRWRGEIRNWSLPTCVWLNPERDVAATPKKAA